MARQFRRHRKSCRRRRLTNDPTVNEIMRLRHTLRGYRSTLTDQAIALRDARSRGERKAIRRETSEALAAAVEKMEKSERLTHKLWDIAKNPLKIHEKIGDRLVAKDKLDQVIEKVHGLTDLYVLFRDAPTIEQNASLVKQVFKVDCDLKQWNDAHRVATELESLMRRNDDPKLP